MAKKQFPGGESPLNIPGSPNVVKTTGPEELIERRGESAIHISLMPCPCPEEKKIPDCPYCFNGFIKTYQEFKEINNELVSMEGVKKNSILPRWIPLHSVQELYYLENNKTIELSIDRLEPDKIILKQDSNLKYWNAVYISYRAKSIEEKQGSIDLNSPVRRVVIDTDNTVIISVKEIYSEDKKEFIKPIGFGYKSISFSSPVAGKLNYTILVLTPIKVAYHTVEQSPGFTEQSRLKLDTGEVKIVIPHGQKIIEGDIITLLTMYFTKSEYIKYKPGEYDFLTYAPVKEIFKVFSRGSSGIIEHKQGEEFDLISEDRVKWHVDKPKDGFSVQYSFHPSYRIQNTGEGDENTNKPRTYSGKFVSNYRSLK